MTNQISQRVYVGTYTDTDSKGIQIYQVNTNKGQWEWLGVAETTNPSFLAIAPNKRYLYATTEVGADKAIVSAFAIDPATGLLRLLNAQPAEGSAPCHVAVDQQGQFVYAANYGSGNVLVYPVQPEGGLAACSDRVQHINPNPDSARQDGPHAHSVNIDPSGRFLLVCDLGIDRVMIYRLDEPPGKLSPNPVPFAQLDPGSGPRHLAFHPDGKHVYVINELNNTITAFDYHAKWGGLTTKQVISTLPVGYTDVSYCADIHVHPNGKFLYGSNRGHESIAIFAIDEQGALTFIGHESVRGKWPRNFAIDPSGQLLYVANERSDNIVAFQIDPQTGLLHATGYEISVPKPVMICFASN